MKEDTSSLTAADLQLQIILETSPVGMLVFNDREEIIAANPPAEHMFSLSSGGGPVLRCGDFFRCINRLRTARGCGHSDACPACPLFHGLRATLAGTATIDDQRGETQLNCELGGEPLWIRYTFRSFAVSGRQGVLLTVDNISDLRRSERQYAQLFREMLNAFSLHEILCDDQGHPIDYRFIAVNPAFELMTGLSAVQVVDRTVLDILPDTEPHWIATYGQVALTGQPIHFENYCREIDKHFSVHAFSPAPGQFACLFEDITQRKRAEELLAVQERKYRDLFEANQDGISLFRINPDGKPAPFLKVNTAAAAMVGYSKAELAGMTALDVEKAVSPESIAQRLATLATTGQAKFETVLIDKDQREIPVEILAQSVDYEGEPAVMNIVRDISARKQAEEALRASVAEKEALLREVHHRVKNNLAAIVGLFDLQRQSMDDPQALTVLAELSGRIRSMSLVHEKLYRSDSLASIDFQEYLHSLISHLRTSFGTARIRCDIAARGVRMPLDLAVPCGMIINELVTNALKYAFPDNGSHPEGDDCIIHIALSRDNNTFTLSVADNGVGLPADFDWRTAKTLGLMLVRMLGQHQLGGRYEMDQRQGTSFTLTFTLRTRSLASE